MPPLERVVRLDKLSSRRSRNQTRRVQLPVASLLPDQVMQAPALPALSGMEPFDRGLLPNIGRRPSRDEGQESRYPAALALEKVLQPPPLPEIEVR
jgi:hypothetical protein